MIEKLKLENLYNIEHLQFMTDAAGLFRKYGLETAELSPQYEELYRLVGQEEVSMAVEKANEAIKAKNSADAYRDKLHSKLFNHLRSILCDTEDPRYDAAQRVMKVVRDAGNPTQLSESAESAALSTLGRKLEPHRDDLAVAGAQEHVDRLLEANRRFMELESECRRLESVKKLADTPSMTTARKQTDATYRLLVNAFNTFASLRNGEVYKELFTEMNILVNKYDRMLSQHKSAKQVKT